ncbi:50S ribosomal protein L24 [bacterium]|nr:50S ribosomal protein L24 [candidate division CSSED10-310 bacterium]
MNIRKNDRVRITVGKDAGKEGKVLKVLPQDGRIIVEGLNFIKRHQRPTQTQQQGGIIEKEAPIHASNLMLICGKCNRPTRVGVQRLSDGSKVRMCRKCGEVMDK